MEQSPPEEAGQVKLHSTGHGRTISIRNQIYIAHDLLR
jgi:hypothetical protein